MKISGATFKPDVHEAIFAREDGQFIVFRMTGVMNMEFFDKTVIAPVPPVIKRPGKPNTIDATNPSFLAASKDYGQLRQDYLMVATIGSSPGVEWDKVVMTDPTTWCNWRQELVDLGLMHFEIEQLTVSVMKANGLAGEMQEARDAFLASMAAQVRAEEKGKS